MKEGNMYQEDKDRLTGNLVWFNRFFQDISSILYRMAKLLEPITQTTSARFYYPKSNFTPGIPDYWLMGITGPAQAVQVFLVLQPELLERDCFVREPSFVVLYYNRPIDSLAVSAYAQRIMALDPAIQLSAYPDHFDGTFPGTDANRLQFKGFQIKLDPFINASDVEQVIKRELVDRLSNLPSWDGPPKAS